MRFRFLAVFLFFWTIATPFPFLCAAPSGPNQLLNSQNQVPEGFARTDWQSIRAAYDATRHSFKRSASGWQASNPGQQWTTECDGRGFLARPKGKTWTWGLELESYGFGERQKSIKQNPTVQANGRRLSYQWDNVVEEWFINDQRGLEHGFTLTTRPPENSGTSRGAGFSDTRFPASSEPLLSLTLKTRGCLSPKITPDGQSVLFQDHTGTVVLDYTGLKVIDADGQRMPSHFKAAGSTQVLLLIDERTARYPLTIDPIAQQAFLKAGNNGGETDDLFGSSVAVSGTTVIIGAPAEDSSSTGVDSTSNDDGTAGNSGAAYIFIRSGTTWTQQAYLKAGNTGKGDRFGTSVAISGDTVVVGSPREDSNTTGINNAPNDPFESYDSGAAYIFTRNGTTWTQQAYLKPAAVSAYQDGDRFGHSVAISAGVVVVGAYAEDSNTTGVNSSPNEASPDSGAAYVFSFTGTAWSQQAYLKPAAFGPTQERDGFGFSVAVSGETIVIGAVGEDSGTTGVNSAANDLSGGAGAAYVFIRNGTVWTQQAYLKPAAVGTSQHDDGFGGSVSLSGNTLVIGAIGEDSATTGINSGPDETGNDAGAAYVFIRTGSIWTQQAYLKPAAVGFEQSFDHFGFSVSVDGDALIVGAPQEESPATGVNGSPVEVNGAGFKSGAAYVYTRSGTTWTQRAYLKPSSIGTGQQEDNFGTAVAVSGDSAIVGSPYENSSTSGSNSTPNESAPDSGSACIFIRSGTAWNQQAYLKASNTESGTGIRDQFGCSVAVWGDTVIIGAYREDSSSTGVNSIPNEDSNNSGAAYIFTRVGTTWTQQAYLKPAAAGAALAGYQFGYSVSISGETAVVGASGDGSAYVFTRSGGMWTQQAVLKSTTVGTTQVNDQFGISVAISGDTIAVGAPLEDSSSIGINSIPNDIGPAFDSGAAYLFTRSGTSWTQQAYLKPASVGSNQGGDHFGVSVAISGDMVIIGAEAEDSSSTGINKLPDEASLDSGAAYIFSRNGTTWTQQAYLKPAAVGTAQNGDNFGSSVAASDNTVVVGAYNEDSNTLGVNSFASESSTNSGAAYVFIFGGSAWTQQAYLKPAAVGTTQSFDQFGYSVALSGDTIAVGAHREDSITTGVNSFPTDNTNTSADNSGAAYLFSRNGTTWVQQGYLKPAYVGTSQEEDRFGHAVAVFANSAIIGAQYERSSTSGVNSIANEGGILSGAAYIFTGFLPDIAVAQAGPLTDGGSVAFNDVNTGSSSNPFTFTITNPGGGEISNLSISKDGANAADFTVSTLSGNAIPVGTGAVTFSVTFSPGSTGPRSAALHLASNIAGTKNPFDIVLTGAGVGPVFSGYTLPAQRNTTVSLDKTLLLTRAADTSGGTLSVTGAGTLSSQGGTISMGATTITYTPPANFTGLDTFSVTIGSSQGGTVTGTVTVAVQDGMPSSQSTLQISTTSIGQVILLFQGTPGQSYQIQRSTLLSGWTVIHTAAAAPDGFLPYADVDPPAGSRVFYRIVTP